MQGLNILQKSNPDVARKVARNAGFLDVEDLKALVAADVQEEVSVLVRCNGGRFVAPASHAQHFVAVLRQYGNLLKEKYPDNPLPAGMEWVRDVSLLAG